MKHKKLLIIGTIILAIGLIITFASLCAAGFDTEKLNSSTLTEYSYIPQNNIHSLILDIDCAKLNFIPTDGNFSIDYQESNDDIYEFIESNGILTVKKSVRPSIVINIFNFDKTPLITLYIPKDIEIVCELIGDSISTDIRDLVFSSLQLEAYSSNIELQGIDAGMIKVKLNSTNISLKDVNGESLILDSESCMLNCSDAIIEGTSMFNIIDSTIELENLSSYNLEMNLNSSSLSCGSLHIKSDSLLKSIDSTVNALQIKSENITTDFDSSYITLSADADIMTINAVDSSVNAELIGAETDYKTTISQIDCSASISPRSSGWRKLNIVIDSSILNISFDGS